MLKKYTVKKYLPVLILILVFAIYLGGQVAFDILDIETDSSVKIAEKNFQYYESIFSKLKMTSINGQTILPSNGPSSIVVLNFWASWCGPCLTEFPSIVQMKKHFGDNILVIGINSDEERQVDKIKEIERQYNLNFPNVADRQGKIFDKFLIQSIPVSIIFHNGRVIKMTTGGQDFSSEEFIEGLEESLAQK